MTEITAEVLRKNDIDAQDAENFVAWAFAMKEKNNLDPDVLRYERTVLCRAKAGDEPIAYVPLQPVLMYESLAAKPEITSRQTAYALWKIGQAVDKLSLDMPDPYREAYFLTSDEREANVCALHGWKIILHDPERKVWLLKHRIASETRPLEDWGAQEPAISNPIVESGASE